MATSYTNRTGLKWLTVLLLIILNNSSLIAQQDPEYTQYMYNMSIVNPAYATGQLGSISIGALYRNQWVGAEGAPTTMTAFVHKPINEKIELGLNLINDEIGGGSLNETNINLNFAYLLPVGKSATLSLGLKSGLASFNTRFSDFQLNSGDIFTDPAFTENSNSLFPIVGFGAFYFSNRYYIGISTPNLLTEKHIEQQNGINSLGTKAMHTFITAGYVFDLNNNLKFKPSFLTRVVPNAPLSLDVNTNFLINESFEIGVSYRWNDSFSGMFNFSVLPSLRIGYAYDYTTSNFGNFNSGTHEVIVLFDVPFAKSRNFTSPRFF